MKLSIKQADFNDPTRAPLLEPWEKVLFRKGVVPDRKKSKGEYSVIDIDDLDQGVLSIVVGWGYPCEDYNFFLEVDKAELDKIMASYFPDSNERKLKEYTYMPYVLIKGAKALINLTMNDLGNSGSGAMVRTNELLLAYVEAYANADMSNIYTSNTSIMTKKAEYVTPLLTEDFIDDMLKSEMISFIEMWNLNIDTDGLKSEIEKALKSTMGIIIQ